MIPIRKRKLSTEEQPPAPPDFSNRTVLIKPSSKCIKVRNAVSRLADVRCAYSDGGTTPRAAVDPEQVVYGDSGGEAPTVSAPIWDLDPITTIRNYDVTVEKIENEKPV
jgi:hypothetical protein